MTLITCDLLKRVNCFKRRIAFTTRVKKVVKLVLSYSFQDLLGITRKIIEEEIFHLFFLLDLSDRKIMGNIVMNRTDKISFDPELLSEGCF